MEPAPPSRRLAAMMLLRASRPVSFGMRLRARMIRLAMLLPIVALSTGLLAACSSVGTAALPGTGPLVTVNMRGGMCMEGACDHSVILERDGRVHSAFDGQELIFEFSVGPGTQRLASCEVDIDWGHPLFVALGVALGEWVSIPAT